MRNDADLSAGTGAGGNPIVAIYEAKQQQQLPKAKWVDINHGT